MSTKTIVRTFTFNGKRYYVRGKTEREAIEKLTLKRKALEDNTVICEPSMTVRKWAEHWLNEYKEPVVSEGWYKELRSITVRFIIEPLGSLKMSAIRPIHLQGILNNLNSYSRHYAENIRAVLIELFRVAYQNRIVASDPTLGIKLSTQKEKRTRRSITEYERMHILKVAETHPFGLFVLFVLYCGLRPGEVAALTGKNIDRDRLTIEVMQAVKKGGAIGKPKTAAGKRIVPIPSSLLKRIPPLGGDDFIFEKRTGGGYGQSLISKKWESFKRSLNISMGCEVTPKGRIIPPCKVADDLQLYCLRHTFCTDLQAAGVPINVAKELMGHSDISTTAKIYTHYSETAFESAREKLNRLHESKTNIILIQGNKKCNTSCNTLGKK